MRCSCDELKRTLQQGPACRCPRNQTNGRNAYYLQHEVSLHGKLVLDKAGDELILSPKWSFVATRPDQGVDWRRGATTPRFSETRRTARGGGRKRRRSDRQRLGGRRNEPRSDWVRFVYTRIVCTVCAARHMFWEPKRYLLRTKRAPPCKLDEFFFYCVAGTMCSPPLPHGDGRFPARFFQIVSRARRGGGARRREKSGPCIHAVGARMCVRCIVHTFVQRRVESARAKASRWRGSALARLRDLDMSKTSGRPSSLFGEKLGNQVKTATMVAFSDDELRDDRLMEGQRLQLNPVVDPSPTTRGVHFPRAGARVAAPRSSSSPPTRPSSPAPRRTGPRIEKTTGVAQEENTTRNKLEANNTDDGSGDKPPPRASSAGRWASRRAQDSGGLGGRGAGTNHHHHRGENSHHADRHRHRRNEGKVGLLLAATNLRRRASPPSTTSQRRGDGGGGGSCGSTSEGGGGGMSRRQAKARSDREADARATIAEMDRAFRRDVVLG